MRTDEQRAYDRDRKRKSRANKSEILLPLPRGTADALQRVMKAAGFDDARDFIAFQIHRLDGIRDCPEFESQTKRTVTIGNLDHYNERLQAEAVRYDDD